MIRSFLLAVFLTTAVSRFGEVFTIIGTERDHSYYIDIPPGEVLEILGYHSGTNWDPGNPCELELTQQKDNDSGRINWTGIAEHSTFKDGVAFYLQKVLVKHIAGPAVLRMNTGFYDPVLTHKLTNNLTSKTSKPVSPKADDIKLTDEFLMLDYTVQANTTYKLGISSDLKTGSRYFSLRLS